MITETKIKDFMSLWKEMQARSLNKGSEREARDYADLIEMGNLALAQLWGREEAATFSRKNRNERSR